MSRKKIKRVFAYVDGFNLYHGIMDKRNHLPGDKSTHPFRKYLWLDLNRYISSFFHPYYCVEKIHYFTAPVVDDIPALRRQMFYWKALESIQNLEIHKGKYNKVNGKYYEKQTDVKMALQIFSDAVFEAVDCIALICADSDQVPTIEKIKSLSKSIEIRIIFPPSRNSGDIRNVAKPFICHKTHFSKLRDNQFPELVQGKNYCVRRPSEWS
jgi:uncharacterized LabA/DUF88 family protein